MGIVFSSEKRAVNAFHKLYYNARKENRTLGNTRFFGVPVQKCPLDLWIYQEILYEIQPDLVIETGTADGGSAYFFACLMDGIGHGEVISIDIATKQGRPEHPRVSYIRGSSTDATVFAEVERVAGQASKVLVVLDSDHSKEHVLDELRSYRSLVTVGSYLIVEDTNVNGHPVRKGFGPGPMEAVEAFLREDSRFEVDRSREKFFLTFNPSGYLRRIS